MEARELIREWLWVLLLPVACVAVGLVFGWILGALMAPLIWRAG